MGRNPPVGRPRTRAAAAAATEPPPGAAVLPPTARTKAPSGFATSPLSSSPACTRYLWHTVGQTTPVLAATTTQPLLIPLRWAFISPLAHR